MNLEIEFNPESNTIDLKNESGHITIHIEDINKIVTVVTVEGGISTLDIIDL